MFPQSNFLLRLLRLVFRNVLLSGVYEPNILVATMKTKLAKEGSYNSTTLTA